MARHPGNLRQNSNVTAASLSRSEAFLCLDLERPLPTVLQRSFFCPQFNCKVAKHFPALISEPKYRQLAQMPHPETLRGAWEFPPSASSPGQALRAIAWAPPRRAAELLAIPGIGIGTVEKYGAQSYRILHESGR